MTAQHTARLIGPRQPSFLKRCGTGIATAIKWLCTPAAEHIAKEDARSEQQKFRDCMVTASNRAAEANRLMARALRHAEHLSPELHQQIVDTAAKLGPFDQDIQGLILSSDQEASDL